LPAAREGAGDPIEVVGAWSDVTARKQQCAEALAAVQERLVHLLPCDIERKSNCAAA
jgi:adenylate cyclase